MAQGTTQLYDLLCRTCGQSGTIAITQNGQRDWHFTAIGFIGLAVNRHNPPNSVLRCNGCSSPQVRIAPATVGADQLIRARAGYRSNE